jgi:hypothetical protein
MKRRDLIKYLSVAPVAGAAIGASVPLDSLAAPAAAAAKRDVIKELGLRTFINAAGTYTTMTASLMHQEVVDTIESASKHFVMITEVQDKVGEKIAAMCHAESAMVTAGCWSALVLGTAGVLTRMDRKKVSLRNHHHPQDVIRHGASSNYLSDDQKSIGHRSPTEARDGCGLWHSHSFHYGRQARSQRNSGF